MNFSEPEHISMLRSSLRKFIDSEMPRNLVKDWDEQDYFPEDVYRKLCALGITSQTVPEEYGGSGLDLLGTIITIEELASRSLGLASGYIYCSCYAGLNLLDVASEQQKKDLLPRVAVGKLMFSYGISEPDVGADVASVKTTAVRDGDYFVINGSKNFITHAISGDVAVVIVRTGEKGDAHGMSAFIIEKGTEGFSAGKKEDKLGMRASETGCLFFDNCRVHQGQLLGEEGEGFIQAMKVLDGGRISIGALGLGIAKGAFKAAVKYSKEREQFGKPISSFQGISFKLADMATEIQASELLLYQAADLKNNGKNCTKISSMAKYMTSEVAVRAGNEAVQIFGGYGYTKEFPAEKYYRDAKLCTIGEGTSEIQKLVISREVMRE